VNRNVNLLLQQSYSTFSRKVAIALVIRVLNTIQIRPDALQLQRRMFALSPICDSLLDVSLLRIAQLIARYVR
jgi:hypothetical protein